MSLPITRADARRRSREEGLTRLRMNGPLDRLRNIRARRKERVRRWRRKARWSRPGRLACLTFGQRMQSHGRRQSSASHGDEMRRIRLHAQCPARLVHLETGGVSYAARHACEKEAYLYMRDASAAVAAGGAGWERVNDPIPFSFVPREAPSRSNRRFLW